MQNGCRVSRLWGKRWYQIPSAARWTGFCYERDANGTDPMEPLLVIEKDALVTD